MGFLEEQDLSNVPTIPEYYKGKTIFISGGSGFIGKVIIEKLLYSCSDLDRIYLLIRSKKGVKSEDRLDEFYSKACFDRLRNEKPNIFKEKVFAIAGDCSEEGLGLSEEDRTLLVNRVNIVFHVAASVRFDDPLTYASNLNLRGTKEMVDLAKDMRNLSSFVHVSTSYSNTNRELIEEMMYPPHADWRDTLDVCRNVPEHILRTMTPKFIGDLPNTYTFTKQLAEHVVYEQRGQLPAVIIRPSIVITSKDEPISGWIENFNGPVGIFVACGKGIMRIIHTNPELIQDYIPVDTCAKHMIAAAWIRGVQPLKPTDEVPIYNCCAGQLQQINMYDLMTLAKTTAVDIPLDYPLWNIGGKLTPYASVYYIMVILQHLLPAIFVDLMLRLLGKKPMLVKVQRRIYTANLALRPFLNKQWTFDNTNFVALLDKIKPEDQPDFDYNIKDVDRVEYFRNSCWGGRRHLLKEKDEDVPKAKAYLKRMNILDKGVQIIFFGCLAYWIFGYLMRNHGDGVNYFFNL